MLEIETKLSMSFYLPMDKQTRYINQELEQYLWFFVDYWQKDWLEIVSNSREMHSATKISIYGKLW